MRKQPVAGNGYRKPGDVGGNKGKIRRIGAGDRSRSRVDGDRIDELFGFHRYTEGGQRLGWLLNYMPMTLPDGNGVEKSGLDLYFIDRDGENFKASVLYDPYFFVDINDASRYAEVANYLTRKFEGCFTSIVEKEDLDLANHLAGFKRKLIKIAFNTVGDLVETKNKLRPIIEQNKKKQTSSSVEEKKETVLDPLMCLCDMREYDVPYTMRVSIDLDIRVGAWFLVTPIPGIEICEVEWQKEFLELCQPRVLAFDIECEKSPLKFPNSENDKIFMISYMTANQGYLIINREIVSKDIEDFEYTPKPSYPGPFKVFNVENEEALLRKFVAHVQELKPHIIVTYNGDKFDWPYVETRCNKYSDLNMYSSLGIRSTQTSELVSDAEYTGRCLVHLDGFCWVQRDSYLPQGNQGLKAVTKYKLGYDPVEVDPEDMIQFARDKPDHMASYSVSDAVATYYLYSTYVHNFIFSLATIIPMGPEDVLRKGSGTLCEALLMVQAYQNNIVCPNKQVDDIESFHNGHLLESETYIGGHVECLEAGVFRADIPVKFSLVPSAFQQLLDHIDRDLTFAIEVEHGLQRSEIVNYDSVKQYIVERLEMLRDSPNRFESPVIYHLDVGAMYPNIILTNRLQPSAMVSVEDCAACKFNQASSGCKRPMTWTWRGEYNPAGPAEYNSVRRQLAYEKHVDEITGEPKSFNEFPEKHQATMIKTRLKQYSQRAYRKTKVTEIEDRTSTVCMREHGFYVDTVKAFRDRRYDYKLLTKTWKNKKIDAEKKGDATGRKVAEDREVLMDSLQLAHKCILNSFYGYVMRKGARWRSMEMAGIVTYTGAQLIRQARELVEQVGRPLELDTDGIWCILPASFPQDVKFKTASGASIGIGYPCAMLNADVHERYTNHQYQMLDPKDPTKMRYLTHSECSIFFELDGPYKAMVLPASPEEGKLLKKKYVVYNFNGSIAELKGFELKRRGELELVKLFQSQVFDQFLAGKTLQECYEAVGEVANQWLDVLDEKGVSMDDDELLHLISERKTISKTVEEYEGRKSTSLTTAGRLADFLGAEMIKDKGLNCNLVISRLPNGAPTTERAIPVAIFSCEPAMRRYFLRKWLKDNSLDGNDFRDVIDWEYYKDRLGKTIQKIITIPAGMQSIVNPCPRVVNPIWITRELNAKASGKKQITLQAAFKGMAILNTKNGANHPFSSPMKNTPSKSNKKRLMNTDSEIGDNNDMLVDLEDFGKPKPLQKFSSRIVTSPSQVQEEDDVANYNDDTAEDFGRIIEESFNDKEAAEEEKVTKQEVENKTVGMNNNTTAPSFITSPPTTTNAFQQWLATRKKQWTSAKLNRKMQAITSGGIHQLNKKSAGVLDFVRNAAMSAKFSTWQVIEVQELDQPAGECVVWAMTSYNQLQRLRVVIPRILYVNVIKSGKDAITAAMKLGGKKLVKELPHGKEAYELFELSLSESLFQRNAKFLDRFFHCAEVEGVYESQVPLLFRSILKLGCVAKANPSSLSTSSSAMAATGKYHLNDLEMVHTKFHPYLHVKSSLFKRIFIYYSANQTRSIGVIGILGIFAIKTTNGEEDSLMEEITKKLQQQKLESEGNELSEEEINQILEPLSAKAYIWIIRGKTGVNMMSKPPFNRIYRKYQPEESVEIKFTTSFVSTPEEAFKAANDRLEQIYRERNGPTVVIAQGGIQQRDATNPLAVLGSASYMDYGFDKKQWRSSLPALQDYPITVMPTNSVDDSFPAVGWQYYIAEKMIQRYLLFPKWFKERLLSSRYSSIPIGNLNSQQDSLTEIMDVMFARQLIQQRHILWASESIGQPDLGQGSGTDQDLWSVWSDPQKEPVLNTPGIYRTISIEIDIFGLAVCAIMSSHELDAEGLISTSTTTAQQQSTSDAFFDPSGGSSNSTGKDGNNNGGNQTSYQSASAFSESGCGKAFNVLKSIITKCIEEVSHQAAAGGSSDHPHLQGNAFISDQVLNNIYRYLCGYGHGYLADPLLHRIIYGLMMKLFYKIIAAFKELGSKIIYANLNKIIVNTHHYTVSAAKEYMEFILNALSLKSTFTYLHMAMKCFWEQMIWIDAENWSALQPLEEFEQLQRVRTKEIQARKEEKQLQQQLLAEQEEKEKEEREKALREYQRLTEKSQKKKKKNNDNKDRKTLSGFFGARNESEDEEEDEEEEEKEEEDVGAKKKKQDYSFLDDINAETSHKGEINLREIKQQSKRAAAVRASYDSDYSDYDMEEEEGEGDYLDDDLRGRRPGDEDVDGEEKDEYDLVERKRQSSGRKRSSTSSRKKRFDSIEDLLDTFEDPSAKKAIIEDEEEEEEGPSSPLIQHWNMINHLPEAAITYFQFTIEEFIFQYVSCQKVLLEDEQVKEERNVEEEGGVGGMGEESNQSMTFTRTKKFFEKNEFLMNQILENMKTWMTQFLTNKLLTITDELQVMFSSVSSNYFENNPFILYHQENQEMIQYTSLAERQYYQNIKSVSFEFVKAISYVLLLDTSLKDSVLSMRRLLLAQLHEQEFSMESDFRNPNLSYILPDVICSYCSLCRDIDLLRDDSLVLVESTQRWKCVNCHNRLNIEEIENRLLTEVNKLTTRYYLQDFYCPKTHLVSRQLCSMYSPYNAENLSMNFTAAEMKKQLFIFYKISKIYRFDYLQSVVEELLQKDN